MCMHEKCCKDYEHDPKECTPEQIMECHGDVEVHACRPHDRMK